MSMMVNHIPPEHRLEALGLCNYCYNSFQHRIRIPALGVFCTNHYWMITKEIITLEEIANAWITHGGQLWR